MSGIWGTLKDKLSPRSRDNDPQEPETVAEVSRQTAVNLQVPTTGLADHQIHHITTGNLAPQHEAAGLLAPDTTMVGAVADASGTADPDQQILQPANAAVGNLPASGILPGADHANDDKLTYSQVIDAFSNTLDADLSDSTNFPTVETTIYHLIDLLESSDVDPQRFEETMSGWSR